MPIGMDSPLSGRVTSRFGGAGRFRSKIIAGVAVVAVVPFLLSTFAASVTVGNGALEFGQGSQQAIACDDTVFVALGEEWHASPVAEDSSAGFFRIRTATISNLNFQTCAGKKIRIRLIDPSSAEIALGNVPEAHVLQITLPKEIATSNIGDSTVLGLTYLTSDGSPITGVPAATVALNVSGTSVYDGSSLNPNSGDLTFYLDPSATMVNIDGQQVRRATVETVNNPS
jgi:hypothetical protein